MAKTKQVLHIVDQGKEYRVIKFYGVDNPYRIYHYYNEINEHGFPTEHRKMMEAYGNLVSCFYWFIEHGIGN